MKYFGILFWLLVCTTTTVFSQEKFVKHKISQGETISSIAEKYNVSQKVIFNLNPKASGILKLNSVLKIPNKNYKKEVAKKELAAKKKNTKEIDYLVLPKETLFGIAKKFNVRVEEIKKNNPNTEVRFWCDSVFYDRATSIMHSYDESINVSKISAGKFRRYNHLNFWQHLMIPSIVFPNIRDLFLIIAGFFQSFFNFIFYIFTNFFGFR